jgi:hypothetical protein
MIDIDKLTLGQIKEIGVLLGGNIATECSGHRFKVGESYLVRTVTMIVLGRVVWVGDKEIEMEEASWVADTGRFYDAICNGSLSEVEPFIDNVIIGRGALIDATIWKHKLPRVQK